MMGAFMLCSELSGSFVGLARALRGTTTLIFLASTASLNGGCHSNQRPPAARGESQPYQAVSPSELENGGRWWQADYPSTPPSNYILSRIVAVSRSQSPRHASGIFRIVYRDRVLYDLYNSKLTGKTVAIKGLNGAFSLSMTLGRDEFAIPRLPVGTVWLTAVRRTAGPHGSLGYAWGIVPIGFLTPIIIAPGRVAEVKAGMRTMRQYLTAAGKLKPTATLAAARKLMQSANYCKWALGCWLSRRIYPKESQQLIMNDLVILGRGLHKPVFSVQAQLGYSPLCGKSVNRTAWLTYVLTDPMHLFSRSTDFVLQSFVAKYYWASTTLRMFTPNRMSGVLERHFGRLPWHTKN